MESLPSSLLVRASGIHSTGVFVRRPLRKGCLVCEYAGERLAREEGERRLARDMARGLTYLFDLEDHFVDGEAGGNGAQYINHSCDPNCEVDVVDGRILILALRDIAPGEELTFDYNFDAGLGLLNAPCRCGSQSCRGIIVAEDQIPVPLVR